MGQVSKLAPLPAKTFSPPWRGPAKTLLLHPNESHKCWESKPPQTLSPRPTGHRMLLAVRCGRVSSCKQKRAGKEQWRDLIQTLSPPKEPTWSPWDSSK